MKMREMVAAEEARPMASAEGEAAGEALGQRVPLCFQAADSGLGGEGVRGAVWESVALGGACPVASQSPVVPWRRCPAVWSGSPRCLISVTV